MAETKKFYWLKLKRDFFKRHDIRIIEEMENGKDYILFYLKMLLESIDHEGQLRFSETIPYNEKMLSVITNTNIDIVRSALKVFTELNMIEIFDEGTIYMSEVTKLIGCETEFAKKKREYRQKLLEQRQCEDNVRQEIEIEKEIELDIDKEKDNKSVKPTKPPRHKYGLYNNVLLTDEDMEKLKEEYPTDYQERIDRLSEYIESKGAKYKNHLATIRAWDRRDKEKQSEKKSSEQTSSNPFLKLLKEGAFDE
jgi:predicted phage replisome organizer